MGQLNPQDDSMCTEQDIERINSHTDEMGAKVHFDVGQLANRVDKLETKLTEDVREIFGNLRDIRKSIFVSQWTSVGITCSFLLVLFGALFNWLWSQDQQRNSQITALAQTIGSTVAKEEMLLQSVQSIEGMVKEKIQETAEESEEDLEAHVKIYHGD